MAGLIDVLNHYVEPGEKIQYAFTGQTGLNPRLRWLSLWLVVGNKPRIVAVTDRRIAMFSGGRIRTQRNIPQKLLVSLPRATRIEHGTKKWSVIVLGNERFWASRATYAVIDKANAALDAGAGSPDTLPPPPSAPAPAPAPMAAAVAPTPTSVPPAGPPL
jgi:hypothetical protein